MGTQQRARRPDLGRTAPIRNWASVVTPGNGAGDRPIGHDVQNANRVVEDYLRAGEASARLFQRGGGGSPAADSGDIAQRMARAASDLMNFWMELFARTAGGQGPTDDATAGTAPPPQYATAEPAPAGPARMAVDVDSERPVTVTVALTDTRAGRRLCVDRLHAREGTTAPLTGITIDRAASDGGLVVRVHVPRAQPEAVYNGVIVDEDTSLPVGTLSVHVLAPRPVPGTRANGRRRRTR